MSSHHVVREAQEPALFIWDTEGLAVDLLAQLLEWSPTLIVREESLEAVFALGIKVDLVVCSPGRTADVSSKLSPQPHVQLISAPTTEEVLTAALGQLEQQGQQAINVLTSKASAGSGLLAALAAQQILPNVVVMASNEKWSLYRNGRFTKWLPANEEVMVQAISPGLSITSAGFVNDLKEVRTEGPQLLHTRESGTRHILARGAFWVAEKLS